MLPANTSKRSCLASRMAMVGSPESNRNYRGNPSLVVHTPADTFVQFDVGKTFRENMVRWYPRWVVTQLDAVVITHGHADAILGLDDLRGLQTPNSKRSMPVFLDQQTMGVVSSSFPYLIPKQAEVKDACCGVPGAESLDDPNRESQKGPNGTAVVPRWVAQLDFTEIQQFKPFDAASLRVTPLPVLHGEDLVSLGFSFGERELVVYLSDVSRVPPETLEWLARRPIDVLVVDALYKDKPHPTHFSLPEALEFVRRVKPKRAILVGMSDDIEYDAVSKELKQLKDINVELAYDGMEIKVKL